WQFALVALAALVLRWALRGSSAALRYLACLAALALVVVAPVATWALLPADQPVARSEVAPARGVGEALRATRLQPIALEAVPILASDSRAAESVIPTTKPFSPTAWLTARWSAVEHGIQPWLAEIVLAWCLGILAFAFRPFLGWYTVRRLRTDGVSD